MSGTDILFHLRQELFPEGLYSVLDFRLHILTIDIKKTPQVYQLFSTDKSPKTQPLLSI